jgi:hypothetical protein
MTDGTTSLGNTTVRIPTGPAPHLIISMVCMGGIGVTVVLNTVIFSISPSNKMLPTSIINLPAQRKH